MRTTDDRTTLYHSLREQRPDWSPSEAARVAAYYPHVSPDHGGIVIAEREAIALALATQCICFDLGATGHGQRHTLCRAHDGAVA